MEVIWTRIGRITYFEILENLNKYWTSKEIAIFHRLTADNLSQISSGSILHPLVDSKLKIRRIVLHTNVTLFYKINESTNRIITFFNNRMDPESLKKLLNFLT